MKIGDKTSFIPTGTVSITRADGADALMFTARALPVDFLDISLDVLGPEPEAPGGEVLRDANGKVIKDSRGHPVREPKTRDPKFLKETARYNARRIALAILWAIHNPSEVSFDAGPLPDRDKYDPAAVSSYLDTMLSEFKSFGLSLGDLTQIMSRVMEISNLAGDKEVAAAKDF